MIKCLLLVRPLCGERTPVPAPRARLGKGTPACGAIPGPEQLEEVAVLLLLFTSLNTADQQPCAKGT